MNFARALMLIVATFAVPTLASAQQLIYVVRHAERADGGAGQMQAQTDPPLSAAGEARAAKLATLLGDAGLKAIYVTEYRRTRDTGKPLADRLKLTMQPRTARDVDALVATLKKDHANDVVLVIAHSNTIPAIVKAITGTQVVVPDDDYDSLFVISPASGVVSRIRY